MKEQILKSLETMSKAQLSKEIGISTYAINKLISDDLETIKIEWKDKLDDYYKSKDEDKTEESHKGDRVTLSIELPTLSQEEIKFFNTLHISSVNEKISTLGYINYVFSSSSRYRQNWFIKLAKDKKAYEVNDLIKRLGLAVLCGKYKEKESDKSYVIKLPSEHYLCKYDNGDIGWSVEPNMYTVVSHDKSELETSYAEYKDFIVEQAVLIKSYNRKTRGFNISERIRKKN